MFIDDVNISFKYSKNELVKKWLKNYPKSFRSKIKNILSINSENAELDLEISKCFNNCEKYYIIESNYDFYKDSIDKLFGKFNFKISYNDILDYEIDPYLSYDLIIFFNNLGQDILSLIKKSFELMSNKGKIFIISCKGNEFLIDLRKYFNLNFLFDYEFKEKLNFDCKIFNTHIPNYINLKNLTKDELLKLTNINLDNNKIKQFKKYANKKYGEHVCVPVSIIILSK